MDRLKRLWSSYRHRFVPWLILNWRTRQIAIRSEVVLQRNITEHVYRLKELVSCLAVSIPEDYLYRDIRLLTAGERGKEVMKKCFGFVCELGASSISKGGQGVFVREGRIAKGDLVAIYPGTLYSPYDPLLLVSIRNQYILRCYDGVFVDGKRGGMSGLVYRSCANRERVGGRLTCDLSWMGEEPVNPLCLGQRVNNQNEVNTANVEYIEMNISVRQLLPMQRRLLPYVNYSSVDCYHDSVRVVGLVAIRPVKQGDELLSNYFTIVSNV